MKLTTTLIAAAFGIALIAGAAPAQNDGIAASPKLRERLSPATNIAAQPAAAEHRCPMCKDAYTTRLDATAKGVTKPTVILLQHLCPSCNTTVSVTGQGKAAQNVVNHNCTMETGACCAPKS